MISVEEAENRIFQQIQVFPKVERSIEDLDEEVVREIVRSDRPLPPFNRVAMDGIAINIDAWKKGRQSFSLEGFQGAGDSHKTLKDSDKCIEVMTGAVLPIGCNSVVRMEDITVKKGNAHLLEKVQLNKWQNVHQEGSDSAMGNTLIDDGVQMFSPHWAVAASVGKGVLQVTKRPKIAIISTGNELVDVGSCPKAYQIRQSNPYAILSALRSCGYKDCTLYHLRDDENEMYDRLGEILKNFDVLILSGGVSVSRMDIVPQVLNRLQVKTVFHKVRQRPGKPLWFGTGERNQLVFALPGNPVAVLVCLHRYVLPALHLVSGRKKNDNQNIPFAILSDEITFKLPLTYFLPVKVTYSKDGLILADPVKTNGSGDFSSLIKSDGFLELPESQNYFSSGSAYPLRFWNR